MDIDLWPIVARSQLVQTFRPGESGTREAPFRTLRHHGWSTAGVSLVTRERDRASGRFTIFSVLNVDAARCGRDGHRSSAVALARAAARVEKGETFARLKALLSGKPLTEVTAAVEGEVRENQWPELHDALRRVARETRAARTSRASHDEHRDVVAGKISEAQRDFLVLEAESGLQTYVPRWLAHSAHRENVGDFLALVTDKLDDSQMVVTAVPAIDIAAVSLTAFTPFGRAAPVRGLTAEDVRLLARAPAPLKILVPVTIGR